jgi:multidrug resistance protein MdtO
MHDRRRVRALLHHISYSTHGTIPSLVVLVAAVSAIAAWVATGSERISYAGLQIAFAFFLSLFQGYAPDTDLDKIRDRFVGILIGIAVSAVIFHYIWPERARIEPRTKL